MTYSIQLFSSVNEAPWLKKITLLTVLLIVLQAKLLFGQTSGNPILANYQADPDITYFNGRYYIYPTAVTNNQFRAYSSADLTNWRDDGVIFDIGPQCSWANVNGWAPCMVYRNGKYYFYYTAEAKIGVAVGDSPTGPFTDKGSPLIGTDPYTVDIIDPMVFVDTDGQAYIYYGGSNGSQMVVRKLNADMTSAGAPSLVTPPNYTEAPHLIKRNGVYHLTYSNGAWYNGTYNVQYATSSSPTGPWTHKGQILSSAGPFTGPGHHAIIQRPGCDEYYIAYHRYQNGDYSTRRVAIDRLMFKSNGEILPVNMTWAGVVARPSSASCINGNALPNGTYKIISALTTSTGEAIALDIPNCGQTAGDDVRTWTSSNCLGQQWSVTYDGNGYYSVISQQPTRHALDLVNCSHDRGTDIKIWNNLNNDCQRWRIEDLGSGWFRILAKQSGYALDVAGCSNVPGANVATWDWNELNCQRWRFVSVSSPGTSLHIEAENYSVMSGIQTEACSEGGLNVGWMDTGDWMVYPVNIPSSGSYTVEYRVASPSGGGKLRLDRDAGSIIIDNNIDVPATGGWQNWTSIFRTVTLSAGQQNLGINVLNSGMNLNWIKITSASGGRLVQHTATETGESIEIFPNPVKNLLYIKDSAPHGTARIFLYDNVGREVIKIDHHHLNTPVDVSGIAEGSYTMVLQKKNKQLVYKLMKK